MNVIFTATAEAGLESIADHIAKDSPRRALSFVHELRETALALAENARAFQFVPRYKHLGVRRRVDGAYLILYRIEADSIIILHIIHGARDYQNLLGLDP